MFEGSIMSLKHITMEDVTKVMFEIKKIDHAKTDVLYIEMHADTLKDLMLDPTMDSYIYSRTTNLLDSVERLFGARIFTHADSNKRNMITMVYKADVLIGDSND